MTIDDVINAKKLDFITKVYRQGVFRISRIFENQSTVICPRRGESENSGKYLQAVVFLTCFSHFRLN